MRPHGFDGLGDLLDIVGTRSHAMVAKRCGEAYAENGLVEDMRPLVREPARVRRESGQDVPRIDVPAWRCASTLSMRAPSTSCHCTSVPYQSKLMILGSEVEKESGMVSIS